MPPWEKYAQAEAAPATGPWAKYGGAPQQAQGQQQRISGSFLPLSRDERGNLVFDPDAGILGAIKRAVTAPGDVYTGRLDPLSAEAAERARELAGVISPTNPAVRAGARAIPGELMAMKPKKPKPPTVEELKEAARAGYKAVRETGAEYPGEVVGAFADDVQRSLEADGLIAELSPQTFSVLKKLRQPPEGSVVTISSLDAARKALNRIAGNFANPHEQEAARRVIERIDDFIQAGGKTGSVAGTPAAAEVGAANRPRLGGPVAPDPDAAAAEAARLIQEARGNAAARFRSERITGTEEAAELRAAAANSGQNLGNALRQRLASLLLNPKQTRGFTEKELDAIRQVVEGTATTNTLRYVSNLLGGGGGIGQTGVAAIGAGFGALAGGWPGATAGAAIPPLLGAIARSGANALTSRQVRRVDEMIRKRSPLYQQRVANPPMVPISPEMRAALIRGLLLTGPSGDEVPNGYGLLSVP